MEPRPEPQSDTAPALPGSNSAALLYVEDERDARGMVSRMLGMNYPQLTLYSADNGASGLASYREHLPEIVMTDINMPVMDGIRMAREIKQINPEVTVIAVTAHSDTSYLLNAIEIGIRHYVLKPINYAELFGEIDKILRQLALQRLVAEQGRRISDSERQLALAQKIAHLGSFQWDPTKEELVWSEELYRILGIAPASGEQSLRQLLALAHPGDRETLERALREAARAGSPFPPFFRRFIRGDGAVRILHVEAEPVTGAAPPLMVATLWDMTELKHAEEEIRALNEELERRVSQRTSLLRASLKELEEFNYTVSHDLRAPVARLEGFCRAMLEDCGDCKNANCLTYAERAAKVVVQVKSIIGAFNELSQFARCALKVETVDLGTLAREIAEQLAEREPKRKVQFSLIPHLPVRADARLLRIVLEHLMENAWKFTARTEQARIELGCTEQGGAPVFYVRDNGAGFNMEYVGKLFKPFQTIHGPDEYRWNGTSIGLAAVHRIILRHGGRVWAEGEVGKGASFYFTLDPDPEAGSFA